MSHDGTTDRTADNKMHRTNSFHLDSEERNVSYSESADEARGHKRKEMGIYLLNIIH